MPENLKRSIQNFITKKYRKEYDKALREQLHVYDAYMQKKETELIAAYEKKTCSTSAKVISRRELRENRTELFKETADVLIVADENGVLNPMAEKAILNCFEEHQECSLLYPDEDICIVKKEEVQDLCRRGVKISERCYPNFKPVPSPETFLSYQYLGNIWAIRTELLKKITMPTETDDYLFEYALLLQVWKDAGPAGIFHLPQILYHKAEKCRMHENGTWYAKDEMERALADEDFYWGNETAYNAIKENYLRTQNIACKMTEEKGYVYPCYELEEQPRISILIPSKDNPVVLEKCISSVYEKSTYQNFEMIVIDNGSSDANKAEIEKINNKYPFTYLYRPMEFNYSRMNNIASKQAEGSILLLLNDDMEVVTPDWLERMAGQLMQEGIGAVGAKLLYPQTTLIQHVGITNAVDGPVHKLLKKDDTKSYHRGRNHLVYNVVGVTGACLMIRKSDYERMGGLKEDLRVAYNDVDLCFSLYEAGLRNVIRNDVILYHHESLSRGADVMSADKMERLKQERDYLYACHPTFYDADPYEGEQNSGGADFGIRIQPDYTKGHQKDAPLVPCDTEYTSYPSGIHVGIDRAERDAFIKVEDKALYVIEGYAVLPESDNCRYIFKLILQGAQKNYCMPITKKLRPNMSAGFPNAKNVELCGFHCWFTEGELPAGEYRVGIYGADRCSRQKLFQDTGYRIAVE